MAFSVTAASASVATVGSEPQLSQHEVELLADGHDRVAHLGNAVTNAAHVRSPTVRPV